MFLQHAAGLMMQISIFPLPLQMGRQTVAGLNPFTIQLAPMSLFTLPEQEGISIITAKDLDGVPPLYGHADVRAEEREALIAYEPLYCHWACSMMLQSPAVAALSEKRTSCSACVAGLLGGLTLKQAVDQKRLFWQDYNTVLANDIAPRVSDSCKH